jgi:hypothetical protein
LKNENLNFDVLVGAYVMMNDAVERTNYYAYGLGLS